MNIGVFLGPVLQGQCSFICVKEFGMVLISFSPVLQVLDVRVFSSFSLFSLASTASLASIFSVASSCSLASTFSSFSWVVILSQFRL